MRAGTKWKWGGAIAVAASVPLLLGADHKDGAAASGEPAADVTDVYAWMSADAARVNLVMDVFPNAAGDAAFSDAVQYVIHVQSRTGPTVVAGTDTEIICTFDAATPQQGRCWAGADEFVQGDLGATDGLTSPSGAFRVFAGRRNDPFFFNLDGFNATAAAVGSATGLTSDANGCPALDETTATNLVAQLAQDPGGGAATDDFAGQSVLSIVVSLDKNVVDAGGPTLAVWGSTHRKP